MAALVHDRVGRDPRRGAPGPGGDVRTGQVIEPWHRDPALADRGPRRQRRRPVLALISVVGLTMAGGSVADAVVGLLLQGAAIGAAAAPDGGPSIEGPVHVVQPGETYWSIAEALGGSGDVRARVDALEAANGGQLLRAGDRLAVSVFE